MDSIAGGNPTRSNPYRYGAPKITPEMFPDASIRGSTWCTDRLRSGPVEDPYRQITTFSESIFAARSEGACELGDVERPTSGKRLPVQEPERAECFMAPRQVGVSSSVRPTDR